MDGQDVQDLRKELIIALDHYSLPCLCIHVQLLRRLAIRHYCVLCVLLRPIEFHMALNMFFKLFGCGIAPSACGSV